MSDGTIIIDTKLDNDGLEKGLKDINSKTKKGMTGLDGEFKTANMRMTKEFEEAAKKSEKSISDFTTKSKSHLSGLAGAAKTGLTGLTTVIGGVATAGMGLGLAIAKVGSDFEAQMSRVKAISGATTEEFKQLQAQAIQLGADTSFSSKEAAEGMENLASAGFNTKEIMAAMPGMLDLAASSGEDLASSADIAASTLRGFGLEADQAGHVADVLAKNAADTNAAVADTGEAMKYISPVAHSMGLSLEEVTASVGLLANAGIKGTQAGTTLRSSLVRLASPADTAAAAMKEIGFNAFDAQGKMLPLNEIIKRLKESTKGLTDQKKADAISTIFGQEALSGMLALVDAGPDKLNELTESYKNSDGAAAEMAKTMKDNLKGSIDQLTGSLESLGLQIYYSVDNPMKEVVDSANDMIGKLSEAFKSGGFEGLTEALGSVLAEIITGIAQSTPKVIQGAVGVIKSFIKGIKDNSKEIAKGAADIVVALADGILELTPEILNVGLDLITKLISGIVDNLPTLLPKIITAGIEICLAITEGMIKAIPEVIKAIPEISTAIIDTFAKTDWSQIGRDMFKGMVTTGTTDGANFKKWAEEQAKSIKTTFQNAGLKEAIKQTLATISPGLNETGVNFTNWAKLQVKSIKDTFNTGGIKEVIKKFLTPNLSEIGINLDQIGPYLKQRIPQIIQNVKDGLSKLPGEIATELGKSLGSFATWNSNTLDWIENNVPQIIGNIVKFFYELPGKIAEAFDQTIDKIFSWSNDSEEAGSSSAAKVVKAILDPFDLLPDGVAPSFGRLKNNLGAIYLELTGQGTEESQKIVDAIIQAFENLPSKMVEIGGHIVGGIKEGIINAKQDLDDTIVGFAKNVVSGFKSKKGFDINSPSRVMRDQVGISITEGISKGILKGIPELLSIATSTSYSVVNASRDVFRAADFSIYSKTMAEQMVNNMKDTVGTMVALQSEIYNASQANESANLMSVDNNQAYTDAKAELERINDLEAGKKKGLSQEAKKAMQKQAQENLEYAKQNAELEILVAKNEADKEVKEAEKKKNRLIQLSEATTEAIKNQLTEVKEAAVKNYDEELTAIENRYNKESELIDSSTERKKAAKDKEIKALEQANTESTREQERQAAKNNINVLTTKRDNTASEADKRALDLQIANAKKELNNKEDIWNIEAQKIALEEEKTILDQKAAKRKKILKEDYEGEKKNLEAKKKATEEYYDKLLENDSVNAKARYIMLTASNDNLVGLLNSYAPQWQDAGQTLADSLLNGLNSRKNSVESAVAERASFKGGSIGGYASGTSYNRNSGLYNVDEENFEINTNDKPVAYVSKGAAISNHMQSLVAIKEEISKQVTPLFNNLKSALYSEQAKMSNVVSSAVNTVNNKTNNIKNTYGSLFNVEHFHNDRNDSIENISNEMGFYATRNKVN